MGMGYTSLRLCSRNLGAQGGYKAEEEEEGGPIPPGRYGPSPRHRSTIRSGARGAIDASAVLCPRKRDEMR
jgi:hypothetical protein